MGLRGPTVGPQCDGFGAVPGSDGGASFAESLRGAVGVSQRRRHRAGDVVKFAKRGDGAGVAGPGCHRQGFGGWFAEGGDPRFARGQGPVDEYGGTPFHSAGAFIKGAAHVHVRDSVGADDEPDDAPVPGRPVGAGRGCPAVDALVQDRRDILGIAQSAGRDQCGQGAVNVQPAGVGGAQRCE